MGVDSLPDNSKIRKPRRAAERFRFWPSFSVHTRGRSIQTGDAVLWTYSRLNGRRLFFERMTQAVRTDGQFFWMDDLSRSNGCKFFLNGWHKPFERMEKFLNGWPEPFERLWFFSERMSQAVRTDANFFWMADKRLVNGIPFKNGKPLVYVFVWEVTYLRQKQQHN